MNLNYYDIQHPDRRLTPIVNTIQNLVRSHQITCTSDGTADLLSIITHVIDVECERVRHELADDYEFEMEQMESDIEYLCAQLV